MSQMVLAVVAGVGSTKFQVLPPLVLSATPQFVPTAMRLPRIEMPNDDGSARAFALQLQPAGVLSLPVPSRAGLGHDVAGCVQVAPASVLTWMPESGLTRPSYQEVATTRFTLPGSTSTSHAMTGRWAFRRDQLTPASVVLKIPPYSLAR